MDVVQSSQGPRPLALLRALSPAHAPACAAPTSEIPFSFLHYLPLQPPTSQSFGGDSGKLLFLKSVYLAELALVVARGDFC